MTQRARKRNRRSRGSVRRKALVALGIVLAAIVVAIGGAAVWALNIWNSTPALGTLKPVEESSTSVVFAADGSRLGYIQSDTIRHPVESGEDPEPPQVRHGGDRGRALLRARRGRPDRGRSRRVGGPEGGLRRPGRLDDHPAAGPQPLHRPPPGQHRAQDRGGAAGDRVRGSLHEGPDPHQVPEHGLLRDHRRPDRGRGPGGRRDLLRKGGQQARPAGGGDDRRPPAGPVPVQPVPEPEGGASAAKRGAAGDGAAGLHLTGRLRAGLAGRISASTAATSTRRSASRTSSTTCSSS